VAEHGRVLGAVGAVAELARDIDRADGGGVEGQGYEALLGQVPRVQAGGLFLDAAAGVADDDGRRGPMWLSSSVSSSGV
jgi:hypothetical protein